MRLIFASMFFAPAIAMACPETGIDGQACRAANLITGVLPAYTRPIVAVTDNGMEGSQAVRLAFQRYMRDVSTDATRAIAVECRAVQGGEATALTCQVGAQPYVMVIKTPTTP